VYGTQEACLFAGKAVTSSVDSRCFSDAYVTHAASLTRLASFDKVARLSCFPEPLAASMIEFHDIPSLSIFIMAVLRFLSSGRPRYLCGGALGCRSDITRSQQSDRHRAAASGQTLIRWAGDTSPSARLFNRAPPLARSPIFLSTGSINSIDRNEISRPECCR
jgi:hypothetical protein